MTLDDKTTIIAALLAALATEASAQSRSFYDAGGKHIGSATIDSLANQEQPI
jgi:hypothetical protein